MIYESKLNYLTLDELGCLDPNPFTPIINKLLNSNTNNNLSIERLVMKLAKDISYLETNRRLNHKKTSKGVLYNKKKERWYAQRKIQGKTIHIKSSKDKNVVQEAYIKYCTENGLQF